MRIILSIMLVLMYCKYVNITVDNIILYNTLIAIWEWLLILVIYLITKNKLHAVLTFALVEFILYIIYSDIWLMIIPFRMLSIIFWLWIYSLWNKYWYRWYLVWIVLHIIYNVSAETQYLFVVISIIWLFIYLILDNYETKIYNTRNYE